MRRWKILITVTAAGFLSLSFFFPSWSDPLTPDGLESITELELKSIVSFLASDEMGGRDTGTPSNRIAGRYLAHQFQSIGVLPFGDDGTYFQNFSLQRAELGDANHFSLKLRETGSSSKAELLRDFYPATISEMTRTSGELVFAGFGISAPEYGYEDYAEIDARGRIAVIMTGEPAQQDPLSIFAGVVFSQYSEISQKVLNAQRHGAIGVILVNPDKMGDLDFAAKYSWPKDPDRRPFELRVVNEQIHIPVIQTSLKFLESVFGSSIDLKRIKEETDKEQVPKTLDLNGYEATIETDIRRENTNIRNVLAVVLGADPIVGHEAVVVGAHFDHVGPRNGKVYNGADDDASGTAALLEIAEAFVKSPSPPRRSIIFALWNAEEKGLLGSRYYVENPPIPLQETVAMFQMDMIGRNQEVTNPDDKRFAGLRKQTGEENVNTLNVIGHSRSQDMKNIVVEANRRVDLSLLFELDNHKLNLIRRSDNWPFLVKGVPAIFVTTGIHPDYHTPEDDAGKINYTKLRRITELVFLSVWNAANTSNPPLLGTQS